MKELRVTFTDEEHKKLKKAKLLSGNRNWHYFILRKCTNGVSCKRNGNKIKAIHSKHKLKGYDKELKNEKNKEIRRRRRDS